VKSKRGSARRAVERAPAPEDDARPTGIALRAAILVLAGALAYWPALDSPFLFDDRPAIVDNATIRTLAPSTVLSPPNDTPVAGRPLTNVTFALNYAAGGVNPRGYRLTNLAIHLLAGLLLFATMRRTLRLPRLRGRFGGDATDLAFAAALLWTLHPLHSEVVNYVTHRNESLMGLFYLLTIYASLRAAGTRGTHWTAVAIAASLAGVFAKESIVSVPAAVLLIDRVLVYDSWAQQWRARRALYGGFAAMWGVLGLMLSTGARSAVGFEGGTSAWVYLLNQAQLIAQYLKLTFWPRDLVLDYGVPQALVLGDVWLQGLVVVALAAAVVVALIRKPEAGLLGAWFFITLAPTSSIVPISTEVGADRRMYLPLVGLVVLFVMGLFALARRKGAPYGRATLYGVPVVLAALMIWGITVRNRDFASPLTMAQTIVDRWPNGRGHYLLGTLLIESGQRRDGMAQLEVSARDYPGALFAIATEQLGAGQLAEGIQTIQRFLELMPNHVNSVPAREMLAAGYAAQGNLAAAEAEARRLVAAAPRYARGHDFLGRLLAQKGDFAGAAAAFRQVLALEPGNAQAQQNLSLAQRRAAGNR
jgi:hypothetical protein